MQDIDLLEFGIYHWLHKTSVDLPGIKSGILKKSFFENTKIENNLLKLIENLEFSRVSNFLDMDKTKSYLSNRINEPNNREDYFLYSILYLINTSF